MRIIIVIILCIFFSSCTNNSEPSKINNNIIVLESIKGSLTYIRIELNTNNQFYSAITSSSSDYNQIIFSGHYVNHGSFIALSFMDQAPIILDYKNGQYILEGEDYLMALKSGWVLSVSKKPAILSGNMW